MHVALTGATGFLGLRLLRCLLERNLSVTVLAHAGSGDALERIRRFLALTGAPQELLAQLPDRLRLVETDVRRPRLGLSRHAFQELADGLDAIWHSAGSINLEGDLPELRRTNVDGTRHVLELAAAGRSKPLVHHVSTAFVAGSRRVGVAYEDELDDGQGFENAYEQSKYEAELLVHAWAREHGRPVVVLRPSVLVTDLPPHPGLPRHPLQVVERILRDALRQAGTGPGSSTGAGVGSGLPRLRIVGDRDGRLNLVQVDHAAALMVRLAERTPSGGVDTYHVVHDRDVPVPVLTAVLERLVGVTIELVPDRPEAPTALEALADFYPGLSVYLTHRRRFDDTRVRALFGPLSVSDRVCSEYLWSGLVDGGGGSSGDGGSGGGGAAAREGPPPAAPPTTPPGSTHGSPTTAVPSMPYARYV